MSDLLAQHRTFISANRRFWDSRGSSDVRSGYIFLPMASNPAIFLSDASLATIVANEKKAKILCIATSPMAPHRMQILASYPHVTLLNVNEKRFVKLKAGAKREALRAFNKLKTPRDLLSFRCDGIRFGDVLYDAILAKRLATVKVIDKRVRLVMEEFFFCRAVIRGLILTYDIKASVFSHYIGLQAATFARYLLRRKIEVINRLGSYQILMKKFQSLKDIGIYPLRPESQYLEAMLRPENRDVLDSAEDYLSRRFKRMVRHPAVDVAFDPAKRIFEDRSEFCTEYNMDPDKPVVFVMLHAFSDYPHSHFSKPMIFQDYYDWFMQTLERVRKIPYVNWVFKEHPASGYYPTKDFNLPSFLSEVHEPHIRFLDAGADFNANSLRHIAHALVTCVGTAGLEYSTVGLPCVLAAESGYGGFGFTIEPRDISAYEHYLKTIHRLKPLSADQMRIAKLVTYFMCCIMQGSEYRFCPPVSLRENKEWNAHTDEHFWTEAAVRMERVENREQIERQMTDIQSFIRNRSWTQYVDLDRFPYFKSVIKPMKTEAAYV